MSSSRYPSLLEPANDGVFDQVYRSEQPRLKRYFDWKAGSEVSQDLVHDVFAKALAGGQADRVENPAAYLWRIAQNLVVDQIRKRRRQQVQIEFDETRHLQAVVDQHALLEADELQVRYECALATLSPRTREIFLMHRVDEFTYKEIAQNMGITCAGVEYHMSKALVHLARRLDVDR